MQFVILGCGTSTGVPIPACNCEVCLSKSPRNNRTRTSALIRLDSGENIIIDTGPDFRNQAIREGIKRVDAVLYTHSHADHILGVEDLRGFNFIMKKAIPCYGTSRTISEIKKVFDYIVNPPADYLGGMLAQLEFLPIENGQTFEVLNQNITPFLLWHGVIPVTGFKIGNLVYATDCKEIPEESRAFIQSADYLILDGLRYKQHNTHLTIDEAIQLARDLKAKKTYLIHMSHDIDYETVNKQLPDGIELAYDGLTLEI